MTGEELVGQAIDLLSDIRACMRDPKGMEDPTKASYAAVGRLASGGKAIVHQVLAWVDAHDESMIRSGIVAAIDAMSKSPFGKP